VPSAQIPTLKVQQVLIGSSPIANPTSLLLKIGGVIYGDAYDYVNVNFTRRIFPTYNASNNNIYITSIDMAHGSNMPNIYLNNVEVLVIGVA
jgi:hypothetical protein